MAPLVGEKTAWQPVPAHGLLARLLRSRQFALGVVMLTLIVVLSLFARLTIDGRLRETGTVAPRLPPGRTELLGSTSAGQSVAAQLAEAVPNSILVGLVAASVSMLVGTTLGFASGYFGGWIDALLRVLIDAVLSVPSLLFLVLIASLLRGVGVITMALIIGAFAWAWPARQIRAQALSLRERQFVDVARLSGMSDVEIIVFELLPHMLPWMGASFVNAFIAAVLAESGLSILGLGPQEQMTLGMMIYWALSYSALLQNLWWWWLIPVLTLNALFLSLYLIHLGFDEVSNPRRRMQA
jgi:peptide/nickel transport system permease protein